MTINDLVGIPWVKGGHTKDGADCWGIFLLALKSVYNTPIDMYLGSKASGDELANIINSEAGSNSWLKTNQPVEGDITICFSKKTGRPEHVGVFVGNGNILHSLDGSKNGTSQIHPVRLLNRMFARLEYYKYVG